jgi:hypothetical protein
MGDSSEITYLCDDRSPGALLYCPQTSNSDMNKRKALPLKGSTTKQEHTSLADYEIQISGSLHERWAGVLGDVTVTPTLSDVDHQEDSTPITILFCPAMDQAKLRGVLNTIWDLNLDLVSVQRLAPGA